MRKQLIYVLVLVATLWGLNSCNRTDGFDEGLLQLDESALLVNGNQVFTYSTNTCQCSFNRQAKTSRMATDGMSEYVVAVFDEFPTEKDETVLCKSLKWTGKSYLESRANVEFKVKEITADGRIWLWSPSYKICLVIKALDN